MALSNKAKEAIRRAVTEDKAAAEIEAAIDSNGSGPASDVGDIGVTSNLAALSPTASSFSSANAVLSTSDTYTDAAVKTAINGAVNAATAAVKTYLDAKADNNDADLLRSQAEARLDAIEAKVDSLLDALRAAGMIA